MFYRTRAFARVALAAALLTTATPLFAATIYVPYAASLSAGDATYSVSVWATNTGSVPTQIRVDLIPAGTDGTARETQTDPITIGAGQTSLIQVDGTAGLLEIVGPDEVVFTTRMRRTEAGKEPTEVQLPTITPANASAAGDTVYLQGWERAQEGVDAKTHFGVVNLSGGAMTCMVDVYRVDGTEITSAGISISAQSLRIFESALGILGQNNLKDVWSRVSCDQSFFTFASVFRAATSQFVLLEPSVGTGDGFGPPTTEPPTTEPPTGDFVYLSDLNWSNRRNIRNGPHKDRSGWDPHHPNGPRGGYKAIQIAGVTYDKGIAFFPNWGVSSVSWPLGGEYRRLTMKVRVDDEKRNQYEWGVVNRSTGTFLRLERPPGGFRATELQNQFRIGSAGTLAIYGDGVKIFQSPEFHAHGEPVDVNIDVTGVNVLKVEFNATGHEVAGAPYRRGLPNPPVLVKQCGWHDLVDLADAKLFR